MMSFSYSSACAHLVCDLEIEVGDVQRISKFFLPNVFCLSADLRISDHIFVFDVDADPEPDPEPDGCGVLALGSMLPGNGLEDEV
jgi:hypothetical protein